MNCDYEGCTQEGCATTSEWINEEALVIKYWCKEHAPDDAEFFDPVAQGESRE